MSHKVDDAATATAMQDHGEHKPSHAALDADDGHEPSGHGNRGRHGADTGKHAGHHVEMFRLRFWWSLQLTVPVILTSHRRRHHGNASTPGLQGSLGWDDSTLRSSGLAALSSGCPQRLARWLRQSRLGQGTDRAAVHAGFQRRGAPRSPRAIDQRFQEYPPGA